MSKNNAMQPIVDKTNSLISTSVELLKLQSIDKSSNIISMVLTRLIIAFVLVMCLIMASIAMALYFGSVLDSLALGFVSVGAFYLVLSILFIIFKKSMFQIPLRDKLIVYLLKENQDA